MNDLALTLPSEALEVLKPAGGASVQRTAFSTSRLLDFMSVKELTMQIGHGPDDWPLVVVKELVDNALDACEEQGIAPAITVTVDEAGIEVSDNGVGIDPNIVDRMLDFSIRVSSREAYVAPDRGAQGNALKTIVAMPFVLDGEEGRVDICGGGVLSEIAFSVDRIAQRPAADVVRSEKTGSSVRVYWPSVASSELDLDWRFLQNGVRSPVERAGNLAWLTRSFAFLNPHATITVFTPDHEWQWVATTPGWQKWTPSSPTCPHWYEPDHLERLIGAYVTHDRQNGNERRTVREFVSEFKGLTSTIKQKAVLEATGLARQPLEVLVAGRDFDHDRVRALLGAMKEQTKLVRPAALGTIGRSHVEQRFEQLGIRPGSFEYQKIASDDDNGLPQVTEVAFAALADEHQDRELITGVNWSAAWIHPFRQLGALGRPLDSLLTEQRFQESQPVALLVHVAHPRVQYADRGKSTVLAR